MIVDSRIGGGNSGKVTMSRPIVSIAVVSALILSGCSSRPRTFEAQLATPAADQVAFDAAELQCRQLAFEGRSGAGLAGSAGTAVAAGAGTAVAGTALASGTYATVGGAMAAAGAVFVAMPVVGVAAAWGLAKAKRAKKEKRIKADTVACLRDQGYEVAGWDKGRKTKKSELPKRGKAAAGIPAEAALAASYETAPAPAGREPAIATDADVSTDSAIVAKGDVAS